MDGERTEGRPSRPPLKPGEVAAYLGISKTTLYKMLDAGTIRGVQAGRRWLVPVTSLEAYLGEPYQPNGGER